MSWTPQFDNDGTRYWYDFGTGQSTYDDPNAAGYNAGNQFTNNYTDGTTWGNVLNGQQNQKWVSPSGASAGPNGEPPADAQIVNQDWRGGEDTFGDKLFRMGVLGAGGLMAGGALAGFDVASGTGGAAAGAEAGGASGGGLIDLGTSAPSATPYADAGADFMPQAVTEGGLTAGTPAANAALDASAAYNAANLVPSGVPPSGTAPPVVPPTSGSGGLGLNVPTGMLALTALSTLGGLASASRKPNVPGNAPTAPGAAGPSGTPLNPSTLPTLNPSTLPNMGSILGPGSTNGPLNPTNPVLDPSVAKAAQDAAYANATRTLDPQWQQAASMKDTALRNQGLVPGGEGYDSAMRDFNFAKNDAYTQARNTAYGQGLQAQGQGFNQALSAEGQNFNQALTGQGQQFEQTLSGQGQGFNQAATNAVLTNQTAQINNAFNQGTYNANVGAQNATTSGLFGLGSTALNAYGLSQNPYGYGFMGIGQNPNSGTLTNRMPSYTGGTP